MAYNPRFLIYLLDNVGQFYTAEQAADGTWTVLQTASADPLADGLYIKTLPENWDKTKISWDRDTTYYGVFRSLSNDFKFALDARAILLDLYATNDTQAYCQMRIDMIAETDSTVGAGDSWRYETFYICDIDFSELRDDKKAMLLTCGVTDGKLQTTFLANASKSFNIPFFTYDGMDWVSDAVWLKHEGIKMYAKWQWVSGATAAAPILPQKDNNNIYPFNQGSVSDARHWIPAMQQYSFVQNNGVVTYMGNDVLQPFLLQQNQAHNYNRNFEGVDDIQAYTLSRGLIKNLLPNPTAADIVSTKFHLNADFYDNIFYADTVATAKFIGFVLFEIGSDDLPVMSGGNYQYLILHQVFLPTTQPVGGFGVAPISVDVDIDLQYDKVYTLGIIYDNDPSGGGGLSGSLAQIGLQQLELSCESQYNMGSAAAVDAPRFPASVFPSFRAMQLFEKLVGVINSLSTDTFGFPIPSSTVYNAASTYLSDTGADRADDYDLKAYNLNFTSENAIRNIKGQQYINASLADFFKVVFAAAGCGLGIENGDTIIIEKLLHFFDSTTEILPLGSNISEFSIEPVTDIKGDNIKAGYQDPQTNKNFGADAFCVSQEYSTQLINTPKTIDLNVSSVTAEQNTIEKARAQRNDAQNSNPSSNNGTVILDISDDTTGSETVTKPDGSTMSVTPYLLQTYPTAQNTDPTAASDPYVKGLYYPDTAINLSVTTASNMYRLGSWLSALIYGTSGITFRKQFQMQYNDTPTALPSIEKNIFSGLITEVADIAESQLNDPLFRPVFFNIKTETPVNTFSVINTNPYGYVSFLWTNKYGVTTLYKGFIWSVSQCAGNNEPTEFKLLAHPDTTNSDIINA